MVMSGDVGGRPARNQPPGPPRASAGWAVTSYLIGGMAFYGGVGWLIGRWTGIAAFFPVGMLLGLALAIALIIFRYARH
jgi:hypothetical protein